MLRRGKTHDYSMDPVVVSVVRVGIIFTIRHVPPEDAHWSQRIVRSREMGSKSNVCGNS